MTYFFRYMFMSSSRSEETLQNYMFSRSFKQISAEITILNLWVDILLYIFTSSSRSEETLPNYMCSKAFKTCMKQLPCQCCDSIIFGICLCRVAWSEETLLKRKFYWTLSLISCFSQIQPNNLVYLITMCNVITVCPKPCGHPILTQLAVVEFKHAQH